MAKASTIKDAMKKWEEKFPGADITQAEEIGFQFQWLPIEKMDSSLGGLTNVKKLSLSTNCIEKITGLNGLKNLRILSLSRNYVKAFTGLEAVADTLEELWISYNLIEKTKGIGALKKLKVLYMSNNLVKEWGQFNLLQECPALEDLLFVGNPLYDNLDEAVWRAEACRRISTLKKLDGETVLREDAEEEED